MMLFLTAMVPGFVRALVEPAACFCSPAAAPTAAVDTASSGLAELLGLVHCELLRAILWVSAREASTE